ncbi:MAG: hypothetical protein K2X66_03495, partial [Cyanobacteria bacterium]|nr:hypothetical protein [Cyanobacteriota bacterium]
MICGATHPRPKSLSFSSGKILLSGQCLLNNDSSPMHSSVMIPSPIDLNPLLKGVSSQISSPLLFGKEHPSLKRQKEAAKLIHQLQGLLQK